MANQLDKQRTSSFNHIQRSLYPNPLSSAQTEHQQILKLQADILFLKLTQLEDKLKHSSKLKRKWNRFKTSYNTVNIQSLYYLQVLILDYHSFQLLEYH